MNEIIAKVTPLTLGIVWLTKDAQTPSSESYKAIDYLLDGLLTASLDAGNKDAQILLSKNFGCSLYVLITDQVDSKQLENFTTLLRPQLKPETDILVLDDQDALAQLQRTAPDDIRSKLKLLK